MRRKDREITDAGRMLEVIGSNDIVRIAFDDGDGIYICPVNYGYKAENGALSLYFHGATSGRKADALTGGVSEVSFEIDGAHRREGGESCDSTIYYECVMGRASCHVVTDQAEKKEGLDLIMSNVFGRKGPFEYQPNVLERTLLVRLDVTEWSCKIH